MRTDHPLASGLRLSTLVFYDAIAPKSIATQRVKHTAQTAEVYKGAVWAGLLLR